MLSFRAKSNSKCQIGGFKYANILYNAKFTTSRTIGRVCAENRPVISFHHFISSFHYIGVHCMLWMRLWIRILKIFFMFRIHRFEHPLRKNQQSIEKLNWFPFFLAKTFNFLFHREKRKFKKYINTWIASGLIFCFFFSFIHLVTIDLLSVDQFASVLLQTLRIFL